MFGVISSYTKAAMASLALPGATWRLWPLFLASTLFSVSTGAITPMLTLQADQGGWAMTSMGILFTLSTAARIAMTLLIPVLLSRLPANKLIAGSFAIIGLTTLLPLFGQGSYLSWVGFDIARGLLIAPAWIAIDLWIYALTPAHERARVLTLYVIACNMGYMLGPLLVNELGLSPTAFMVFSGLVVMSALPFTLMKAPKVDYQRPSLGHLKRVFRVCQFTWVACFISGYASESISSFLGTYGLRLGMSDQSALYLLSVFTAGAIVLQYPLSALMDRLPKRPFCLGLLMSTFLMLAGVVALAQAGMDITLGVFVLGGLCAMVGSLGNAMVGVIFSARDLVLASTINATFYDLGDLIGPVLNGTLMDLMGPHGLMVAAMLMFGVSIGFGLYVRNPALAEVPARPTVAAPWAALNHPSFGPTPLPALTAPQLGATRGLPYNVPLPPDRCGL